MSQVKLIEPTDLVWAPPASPGEHVNIGDLSDILDFLAALLGKLFAGKGRGWLGMLVDIGSLADETFAAINGIENVLPTLMNLSNEQRRALVETYAERFDLPNDRAELIVEHMLNIVLEGFQVFSLATQK